MSVWILYWFIFWQAVYKFCVPCFNCAGICACRGCVKIVQLVMIV